MAFPRPMIGRWLELSGAFSAALCSRRESACPPPARQARALFLFPDAPSAHRFLAGGLACLWRLRSGRAHAPKWRGRGELSSFGPEKPGLASFSGQKSPPSVGNLVSEGRAGRGNESEAPATARPIPQSDRSAETGRDLPRRRRNFAGSLATGSWFLLGCAAKGRARGSALR